MPDLHRARASRALTARSVPYLVPYVVPCVLLALAACTSGNAGGYPQRPDASCPVVIDKPASAGATHVTEGAPVSYVSNPAAGGPHYPVWATWSTHVKPVAAGYYVHNLEHGGIVMLYKCADAACAQSATTFLEGVANALPTDPSCVPPVRVRVLIAPDPTIPTPFAAAAWGFTYTAECADMGTLLDFARAHYAKGPEDLCANGSIQ